MSPAKRNPKTPKGKKVSSKPLSPGEIAKQLLADDTADKEREEEEEDTAPAL